MDIAFVISHKPDIRYQKRLAILAKEYDVAIIYWNKDRNKSDFIFNGVKCVEIRIPANKTNPLKRIPETYLFVRKAYKKICELSPKCVYVGNLDMLYIANKYKNLKKETSIIYEIADLHRLIIDKQNSIVKKWISKFLVKKEKRLTKRIDLLVLTSQKFYDIYYEKLVTSNKYFLLPNIPEDDAFNGFEKAKHEKFTIGFVGAIRYKNQLRMLIEASQDTNTNVYFAGSDGEGNEFENECKLYNNVFYRGEFNYKAEIKDIYKEIDCIYAVYDADMVNVRVALPNKLYESIKCEIPIVVAKNTYLAELVEKMGIGVAVDHKDKSDLVRAINSLSENHELYNIICNNCKRQQSNYMLSNYNDEFKKKVRSIMVSTDG